MKTIILSIQFMLLTSCISSTPVENLPLVAYDSSEMAERYRIGETFRTRVDLLLAESGSYLVLDDQGGIQPFVDDYIMNKGKYPRVKKVVPAGSVFSIVDLMHTDSLGSSTSLHGVARFKSQDISSQSFLLLGVSDYIFGTSNGVVAKPNNQLIERMGH